MTFFSLLDTTPEKLDCEPASLELCDLEQVTASL